MKTIKGREGEGGSVTPPFSDNHFPIKQAFRLSISIFFIGSLDQISDSVVVSGLSRLSKCTIHFPESEYRCTFRDFRNLVAPIIWSHELFFGIIAFSLSWLKRERLS
jgi:hypothetical protein